MRAEARVGAERVRNLRQGLAEMRRHQLLVGDIVGNLAQAVHIVGKRQKLGLDRAARERFESVADHGGARHLAERADMRQAGRPVAGFEQDLFLPGFLDALGQLFCFFERPGRRGAGKV